jgi:regulator of sigma E protease
VLVRTGLVEAIRRGSEDAAEAGVLTVAMLWKIISLQTSPRAVGGPVMIAGTVGQAAQSSFSNLVWIVVLISVSLGIFNILPLPPFDGGHILFTVIEAVLRREINLKYKEAVFRVAMTFILVLFVLITVNDIMRYRQGFAEFFHELAKGLGLL